MNVYQLDFQPYRIKPPRKPPTVSTATADDDNRPELQRLVKALRDTIERIPLQIKAGQ
jgi:hypothetical protein